MSELVEIERRIVRAGRPMVDDTSDLKLIFLLTGGSVKKTDQRSVLALERSSSLID